MGDHVNQVALALDLTTHAYHGWAKHWATGRLECPRPYDEVGDVRFILERQKHDALRRSRLLPDKHDAGKLDVAAIVHAMQLDAGDRPTRLQLVPQEGEAEIANPPRDIGRTACSRCAMRRSNDYSGPPPP